MNNAKYTIDQIGELTGTSRRTIRYYIQESLLEAPAGRGRGGFYYDSHIERLQSIRMLQEKGLKLAAIRQFLSGGDQTAPMGPESREIWVRCTVAPGIEIHVRRDVEERDRKHVQEIVRVARTLLTTEGSNENE